MNRTHLIAIWGQIKGGRFFALAVLISFAAFLLFAVTSDFPPYESETILRRICVITSGILSWPVVVLAPMLPDYTPGIVALPLFSLPGLFWAALTEIFLATKHARSA
jgi:hypothetical protein